MNKINHTNDFFGVDRAVVEAAIVRGRQERAEAFRTLLQSIFSRPGTRQPGAKVATNQSGTPAHC